MNDSTTNKAVKTSFQNTLQKKGIEKKNIKENEKNNM